MQCRAKVLSSFFEVFCNMVREPQRWLNEAEIEGLSPSQIKAVEDAFSEYALKLATKTGEKMQKYGYDYVLPVSRNSMVRRRRTIEDSMSPIVYTIGKYTVQIQANGQYGVFYCDGSIGSLYDDLEIATEEANKLFNMYEELGV